MRTIARLFCALLAVTALPGLVLADDDSGVSPNRLKLPKGPGSLEGVGENAQPNLNMGLMSYSVPLSLPAGYEGMTPSLSLAYNSGAGNSVVGIGWSLSIPSIERMTARGLPSYDSKDAFAANGGDELVRVPGTNTFRARYEGAFVRYRWIDTEGTGRGGYWIAEYPDGRIGYFGARASGELVPEAKVTGAQGTFRYHLVETVDVLGHRVLYDYSKDGALSHPSRIRYAFEGSEARYEVRFQYAERPDLLSDGKPGYELLCSRRLVSVQVLVRGTQLRRYGLAYDLDSPGLSRLAAVRQYGMHDSGPYPIAFRFAYSGGLGEACNGGMCNAPKVVRMDEPVGLDFRSGTAELIDMNGDALPDIVDTADARHRIFLNVLERDAHRFSSEEISATGAEKLATKNVQMFDLDGDGFADMVNARTSAVLRNDGSGDWAPSTVVNDLGLPDFETDANARFFDFNYDKRIDVIHADGSNTWYHRNLGGGAFVREEGVAALGAGFAEHGLQLADMNGDGMQDIVWIADGLVSYRMHLGFGEFAPWREMDHAPDVPPDQLKLWDLNGDGLADAVYVAGSEVVFALNESGRTFETQATVLASSDSLPFPEKTPEVSLRLADMNGNGSTDIVWIDPSGQVTYLELFPHRPNLLTRIDNGIGKVIEVAYGSSVDHMVASGGVQAWEHRLPSPMLTVDAIATYDTLSGVRQHQRFYYRSGFWDGEEKQFRGFAHVEAQTSGDDHMEAGRELHHFDVGDTDSYRKGLLLSKRAFSADRELDEIENTYDDCSVADISGSPSPPIRFVCQTQVERTIKEGLSDDEWVTTEEAYLYDGYGNRTTTENHGVIAKGGGSCGECDREPGSFGAPCGRQCLGDESFETTEFVAPQATGERWILHKPARKLRSGERGSSHAAEETFHYDGEPFKGLPAGELTLGLQTRVETKERADRPDTIATDRVRRDEHGVVVETLDPNGHRRSYEYDEGSLLMLAEVIHFDDQRRLAEDAPYALRMEAAYHPVLEQVTQVSHFRRVVGGRVEGAERNTVYAYDDYGRLAAITKPGDTLEAPTEHYLYDLADPVSRIVHRGRTQQGGSSDLYDVQCFDGLGRKTQTRTLVEPGKYQVSGFVQFNLQGKPSRTYQAYQSPSDRCDRAPPKGVRYQDADYDAIGRPTVVVHPDADMYGTASVRRTQYLPLRTVSHDEEDTDSTGPHADTPLTTWVDGLGRTVAFERQLKGSEPTALKITYDTLGHPFGHVDARGNRKRQWNDLLGRVLRTEDPDRGKTSFSYDASGNSLSRTDARGKTTAYRYDEADRLVAQWDTADESATRIRYRYDSAPDSDCASCQNLEGLLAEVQYPISATSVGIDHFGYDERTRQTYRERRLDGHRFPIHTRYDNADRAIQVRYPGDHVLTHHYDGLGRPTAVDEYLPSVAYDERGLLAGFELGNGVTAAHAYDARMRLSRIDTIGPDGAKLQAYAYTRDRMGNLLTITDDSDGFAEAGFSHDAAYAYDAWYRLVTVELEEGPDAKAERIDVAYDGIDNILSKTSSVSTSPAHVGDYIYDQKLRPHGPIRAGPEAWAYDDAGHVTQRGGTAFDWDYAGRLVRARRFSPEAPAREPEEESSDDDGSEHTLAQFTYGAGNERVKKVEDGHTTYYVDGSFELRDGVATLYVRLGNRRVAKLEFAEPSAALPDLAPATLDEPTTLHPEPDGRLTAGDAWIAQAATQGLFTAEDTLDDSLVDALLAASARALTLDGPSQVTYLSHDHLGTEVLSTDAKGKLRQRSAHYPFGSARAAEPYLEDYSFTGQETDPSTELSYHSARYLSTHIGRWTAADPLFETIGEAFFERPFEAANPYAYARNNPVNALDRAGTSSWTDLALDVVQIGVGLLGEVPAIGNAADVVNAGISLARGDTLGAAMDAAAAIPAAGQVAGVLAIAKRADRVKDAARTLAGPVGDGVKGLWKFAKKGFSKCFPAGVVVAAALGPIPIENVRVGQRVLPDSPECAALDTSGWWRATVVREGPTQSPLDRVAITLLRPAQWLEENGVAEGGWVQLQFEQFAPDGWGFVTSLEQVGSAPQGPGCPVTATIASTASELVSLTLAGYAEPLEVTPSHPLFSETRNAWVAAGELQIGDELRTQWRNVRVLSISHVPRRGAAVYNLEVQGSHRYFVDNAEVWAHNGCGKGPKGQVDNVISKVDDVISETLNAKKKKITSRQTLSADEALEAGERFVGQGYKEIGKPGSGVFRSADDTRQFRMDSGSLRGAHPPNKPHVHLETYAPGASKPTVNNHIPFVE